MNSCLLLSAALSDEAAHRPLRDRHLSFGAPALSARTDRCTSAAPALRRFGRGLDHLPRLLPVRPSRRLPLRPSPRHTPQRGCPGSHAHLRADHGDAESRGPRPAECASSHLASHPDASLAAHRNHRPAIPDPGCDQSPAAGLARPGQWKIAHRGGSMRSQTLALCSRFCSTRLSSSRTSHCARRSRCGLQASASSPPSAEHSLFSIGGARRLLKPGNAAPNPDSVPD